jgi:hypothetical protein
LLYSIFNIFFSFVSPYEGQTLDMSWCPTDLRSYDICMTSVLYVSNNLAKCPKKLFFPLLRHSLNRCLTPVRHSYDMCRTSVPNFYFFSMLLLFLDTHQTYTRVKDVWKQQC